MGLAKRVDNKQMDLPSKWTISRWVYQNKQTCGSQEKREKRRVGKKERDKRKKERKKEGKEREKR